MRMPISARSCVCSAKAETLAGFFRVLSVLRGRCLKRRSNSWHELVIVPYFHFGGRLIVKLSQQVAVVRSRYPSINIRQAAYLGSDPGLFSLMDDRVNETLAGSRPVPCDTCQYRVPVSGVSDKVGGNGMRKNWLTNIFYTIAHRH